jgi:hypothetical protein
LINALALDTFFKGQPLVFVVSYLEWIGGSIFIHLLSPTEPILHEG